MRRRSHQAQAIPSDPEAFYLAAKHTAIETLQSGGTTIMDHVSLTPGNEMPCLDAVVRAYRETGIRAVVAPLIFDLTIGQSIGGGGSQAAADPASMPTKHLLDFMAKAVEKYARCLLRVWLTPFFASLHGAHSTTSVCVQSTNNPSLQTPPSCRGHHHWRRTHGPPGAPLLLCVARRRILTWWW